MWKKRGGLVEEVEISVSFFHVDPKLPSFHAGEEWISWIDEDWLENALRPCDEWILEGEGEGDWTILDEEVPPPFLLLLLLPSPLFQSLQSL